MSLSSPIWDKALHIFKTKESHILIVFVICTAILLLNALF